MVGSKDLIHFSWQLIHSLCLPLSPLIKYLPENIASRHEEHNLFLKQKQGLNQLYKRMFRKLSCKINALSPAKPPPLSQMFYHFTYFLILCFLAYFFLCSLSVTVLLTVKTQGFRTVIMPPASCKTLTHIDNFWCTLNNAQFTTDHR